MSPTTAAVFFEREGVVRLLREWNLDAESSVICNTCPENECDGDGGCTPIELADRHGPSAALKAKTKRKRTTPVLERAAKLGLALAPTPDGVRDQLKASSPSIQAKGKHAMQRHQKACHQRVDREELKQGRDSAQFQRRAMRGALATRRSKLKKKHAPQAPPEAQPPDSGTGTRGGGLVPRG